jgi:hypothetical protein
VKKSPQKGNAKFCNVIWTMGMWKGLHLTDEIFLKDRSFFSGREALLPSNKKPALH